MLRTFSWNILLGHHLFSSGYPGPCQCCCGLCCVIDYPSKAMLLLIGLGSIFWSRHSFSRWSQVFLTCHPCCAYRCCANNRNFMWPCLLGSEPLQAMYIYEPFDVCALITFDTSYHPELISNCCYLVFPTQWILIFLVCPLYFSWIIVDVNLRPAVTLVTSIGSRSPSPDVFYVGIPAYNKYESSSPSVRFLLGFNFSLSVKASLDLAMPKILPDKTVVFHDWSKKVPEEDFSVLPGNQILSLNDTHRFLGDQPEKFAQGYHSVVVKYNGKLLVVCLASLFNQLLQVAFTSFTFEILVYGQMQHCCRRKWQR